MSLHKAIMEQKEPVFIAAGEGEQGSFNDLFDILEVDPPILTYFWLRGIKYKSHSGLLFKMIDRGEYEDVQYEVYKQIEKISLD